MVAFTQDTETWCDPHAVARAECGCPVPSLEREHRGQLRMAYRLADTYADRLLHVHGVGWHVWDGTRWVEDERGAAHNAVFDVLRRALADSLGNRDLDADVRKCESANGVEGVLKLAAALDPFAVTVTDLDQDGYLLNCANGTLDLRTGELRDHDPRDLITKVTTAAYDPQAAGTVWSEFLATVLPDEAVRGYFQRFVGLALLGMVREHIFTIATGEGANGKGTAYNAILDAVGDYGHVGESDLFMRAKANPNAASPAQMRLRGRRLVIVSETERDHHLAAALMKNLTGGDPVTARPLYGSPVTFDPSHTVLMVTNHLPTVAGDDPAIWRRIRVVPFDVVIPEPQRDGQLGERLQLEADAILAWAVAGYHQYIARGMDAPPAVVKATDDYHTRSDAVARFIGERCMTGPAFNARVSDLFDAFARWCQDDGAEPLSKRAFGEALDKAGHPVTRGTGGVRYRAGIGLLAEDETDE